jgi:hypothetical protein
MEVELIEVEFMEADVVRVRVMSFAFDRNNLP